MNDKINHHYIYHYTRDKLNCTSLVAHLGNFISFIYNNKILTADSAVTDVLIIGYVFI